MSRSRQLAAIMFTDIQGYTALMQQNEGKAIQARDKHRHIFNSITEKYRGKILQYYGDGTLSIFDSAIDAVECGIEMQLGFQEAPIIPVRIGIHTGDIVFSEEEIIGDSVNVASRIESLAVPGSVFISGKVYDEIKNQESIQATLLKRVKLKNVSKPIDVYAISNEGLVVPNPEAIEGKIEEASPVKKQPEVATHAQQAISPSIILTTKLYIPRSRSKVVLRPRLIERLNEGLKRKLTLVSAPAGFGKSTLVSDWVEGCEYPVAWLSLDEADSDPPRFLSYFIAALQTIDPGIGEGVLGMLHSPQPPPIDSILTALLNDITTISNQPSEGSRQGFILVLDDYHLIDSPTIDIALTFLLDHLPPHMHLVIATREDPPLPLARLRVRSQLTELRAIDLRFTSNEAADFLNEVMGLKLSPDDIASLETRTEGWVAGLQLAALSMQGREDVSGFIKSFAGHDRYIVDYLLEEVMKSQPEEIRNFLLRTSILDRLNSSLCDAVTHQGGSKGLLETLERENLFIVPLDDKRKWYRYHHLFGDVLYAHLMEEYPDEVPVLHLRASEWYDQNDMVRDAVRHAFAAKDLDRVASLIELAWPALDENFETAVWLGWAKQLPVALIRSRPVLCLEYTWALLNAGKTEAALPWLQDAERWLDTDGGQGASLGEMVVVDKEQFRFLPASIATARGYIAQTYGDVPGTVKYGQQALDLLPENDHLRRGPSAALLGLAQWTNGDLEAAYWSISEAMDNFQQVGNLVFALSGTYGMADIRIAQGRLNEAIKVYEKSLKLALEQGEPVLVGTADLYMGLGEVYLEQGDMDAARQHLLKNEELGEQAALPDWPCRLCLAQAKMKEAQGDLEGALERLDEAERLYYTSPLPNTRPIPALRARLWTKQGRLAETRDWVQKRGISVDGELNFLNEFEHITLARILIAAYRADENSEKSIQDAMGLLQRLQKSLEDEERIGNLIEILVQQALAYEALDDIPSALKPLEQALSLAEPEGYVRIFVNEGTPMATLLAEAKDQGIMPEYVGKLLEVFTKNQNQTSQPLVDPLSERELEVLQLIGQGLSNRDISERLFLSLSTIKGHNQHIFSKLGVQRRTEAVAKARELGLL